MLREPLVNERSFQTDRANYIHYLKLTSEMWRTAGEDGPAVATAVSIVSPLLSASCGETDDLLASKFPQGSTGPKLRSFWCSVLVRVRVRGR